MSLPRLASLDSLRDVAGSGHRTRDGGRVRRRVLYRSGELQLTDEDTLALVGLGLTAIHDLRTAEEVAAHPDAVIPGATWRHYDVAGIPMDDLIDLPDEPTATALMERVYRSFVEDAASRRAFGALLTRLSSPPASRADGPQLVHCTTGKDRTGWAAALLLAVAGVPEDTIFEDYLRTNECTHASRGRYVTMVGAALGEEMVPVYERVLVADERYLRVAWEAAETAYGSLEGYLNHGLGVETAVLERLRQRLTE